MAADPSGSAFAQNPRLSYARKGPGARLRQSLQASPTFINFVFGGGVIAMLGAGMLGLLVRAGVSPHSAQAAQLTLTLVLNFAYNSAITWRGRPKARLGPQVAWFPVTGARPSWRAGTHSPALSIGAANTSLPTSSASLLATEFGAKVASAYSATLATREESPPSIFNREAGSLFWQRDRWIRGFLAELMAGRWRTMPTLRQRILAGYVLATPILQAISFVLLPAAALIGLLTKTPIAVAVLIFTPILPIGITVMTQLIGLRDFCQQYGQRASV